MHKGLVPFLCFRASLWPSFTRDVLSSCIMPQVSVVITTYNRAQLLQRAIESAWQAGPDLEVIVVDDCSTDETPEICSRLPSIRYVRLNTNGGLANARNVGIAECSSEFVTFLDD